MIENIKDDWWHETIRLYAARSGATNLIIAACKVRSVETLALAVDCAQEGLDVDPTLREELENLLDENCLESSNQKEAQLAASVKLTRRLQNLLRLDNDTEIDPYYITCAEYQLFIDKRQQTGENHQPAHWRDSSFSYGDATKPISGIRGSDAKEFCEWLNQRYHTLEFCYRLPRQFEVEEYPAIERTIGCWCQNGETLTVQGITSNQWQAWEETIQNVLNYDLKNFHKIIQEFDKTFACAKKLDSSLESLYANALECIDAKKNIAQGRDSNQDRVRDCNRAITKGRYRVQNYGRELNRILDINHAPILSLNLDRSIDFSFIVKHVGAISRDLKPVFNLTHTQTFDSNPDRALVHEITLARKRVSELIREIKSIHFFAEELAKIFGSISSLTNRLTSVLDLSVVQALKNTCNLSHELKQNWEEVRTWDETRLLDNSRNRVHLLDQSVNRNCINTNDLDFQLISSYCLLIYGFWQLLLYCYKNISRNKKNNLFSGLGKSKNLVDKYTQEGDKAFDLYLFFVWMHERRMNHIPSWGGVRIVKQRIKT